MIVVQRPEGSYSGYKNKIVSFTNGEISLGASVKTSNNYEEQNNLVLLHGSGGLGSDTKLWERVGLDLGYKVITIDHFTGRGIEKLLYDGSKEKPMSFFEVYDDFLCFSQAHSKIFDNVSTSVVGFSMGGAAAMLLNSDDYEKVFALYPLVLPFMKEFEAVDGRGLKCFFGASDNWTKPEALEMLNSRREEGGPILSQRFEDSYHSFSKPCTSAKFKVLDLLAEDSDIYNVKNREEFSSIYKNQYSSSRNIELKDTKIEFSFEATKEVLSQFFDEDVDLESYLQIL